MTKSSSETFGHGTRNRLVWVDLETTGLDPDLDIILEVAIVVTDWNLRELDHGSWIVRPPGWMPAMHPEAFAMHARSGLLTDIANAPEMTLAVVDEWATVQARDYGGPMAGATPSFDRQFIRRYMPKLNACFDYRHFDVSTLKQAYRMWADELPKDVPPHRALADIRGTIEECRELKRRMHPARWLTLSPTPKAPSPVVPMPEPMPAPERHPDLGPEPPNFQPKKPYGLEVPSPEPIRCEAQDLTDPNEPLPGDIPF